MTREPLLKRSRIKLPLDAYKKLVIQVHRRDGWRCRKCRCRTSLHCHHIKFRSQGGDDTTFNLVTVCDECHEKIHRRELFVLPKSGCLDEEVNADEGVAFWVPEATVVLGRQHDK